MSEKRSQLPQGFHWANELPPKPARVTHPPPAEKPRKGRAREREVEEPRVHTLREALGFLKIKRPSMRKEKDVSFEGARIGAIYEDSGVRYLILFKREFYLKFGEHFPHVAEKGYGVLCAKKIVAWAADENLEIASIFPDGRCYHAAASELWMYYELNKTDCPHVKNEIASPLSMWRLLFK